ncbi:MAG: hypothetical protein R6U70_11075 [Bacillota bacterium]
MCRAEKAGLSWPLSEDMDEAGRGRGVKDVLLKLRFMLELEEAEIPIKYGR